MYVNKHTFLIAALLTGLVVMLAYMRLDDRVAQLEHIVYQQSCPSVPCP